MSEDRKIIIYTRHIKLDVVIPAEYVKEFINNFEHRFAIIHPCQGTAFSDPYQKMVFRAIGGYYAHPDGWHIQVVIWENDEDEFYDFLKKFCKNRSLSFRKPRKKKG